MHPACLRAVIKCRLCVYRQGKLSDLRNIEHIEIVDGNEEIQSIKQHLVTMIRIR